MTHSTIMQRLILLTAVPVIALIMSSGTLIWDSFGRYQSAGQAHSIMEVAVAAGDLIHPMQIERGMTAGYISSSGQKFADTLPEIRIVTDEKHAAFRRLLKGFDTGGMPNLKKVVDEALHKLDGLAGTRDQVNKYRVTVGEAAGVYTSAIASLLEVMSTAANYNSDPKIAGKIMNYHYFPMPRRMPGRSAH